MIKSIIKNITNSHQRAYLKKIIRRLHRYFIFAGKNSLNDLELILRNDFKITEGDNIFVTSSFGNLNASFSPEDLIGLLQSIVTEKGLIMMPYYPSVNSIEWAKSNNVFDMKTTKSGMGILTNVFAEMPNVVKSIHPTKAVCIWGKNSKQIAEGHHLSLTPYSKQTPYGKLLSLPNSKSLCLGVINLPMFHAIEDLLIDIRELYYEDLVYKLRVKTMDNRIIDCNTLIHSPQKSSKLMMGGEYVKRFGEPLRIQKEFGHNKIYCIDNNKLLVECMTLFRLGITRKG